MNRIFKWCFVSFSHHQRRVEGWTATVVYDTNDTTIIIIAASQGHSTSALIMEKDGLMDMDPIKNTQKS